MLFHLSGNISEPLRCSNLHMPATPFKKILLAISTILLVTATLFLFRYHSGDRATPREQLLTLIPADSSAVIFLDADEFKQSSFLAKLYSWAPHPAEDSEYSQFVRETGFSWERDLQRIVVAI